MPSELTRPVPAAIGRARSGPLRRLCRAAKIVALNLIVLVLLLIPIELYFGDWLAGDGTISLLNVRPNTLDVEASPLYPAGTTITYRRDRYGFRGAPADPAAIDVLAIGGSTTNERFVDEADTWTARLQRALRESGCAVAIANAGIDGYSTVANIASFDGWFDRVPGLKPRFMLVLLGVNDAEVDPRAVSNADSQKYTNPLRRLAHYVAARSAVRRLYVAARGWWQARRGHLQHGGVRVSGDAVWQETALPPDFAAELAGKLPAYRARLTRLTRLIRDFGARPIYITQQRRDGRVVDGQWQQIAGSDGARDTALVMAINETTLDFCHDTCETCIDLAGRIDFAPEDYYDAVHTAPAGSARIAAFLAPALRPVLCRDGASQAAGRP